MNNDFIDRKIEYEYYHKKNLTRQQSTNNHNLAYELNENKDKYDNKIIIRKKMKNKLIHSNNYNESKGKLKNGKNKSEVFNNINDLSNNDLNNKFSILNKRINLFKERCLKSLGKNFYNKAYNYLKKARKSNSVDNDKIREFLTNTFGKNNIGYWQLIDQILFLEGILNTT
jgi:hypothetical protein